MVCFVLRPNVIASLSEVILRDEQAGLDLTASSIIEFLFSFFGIEEDADDLTLRQAQLLVPTAIEWWVGQESLRELEDEPELLLAEEQALVERLGIRWQLLDAGMHIYHEWMCVA